VTGCGALHNPRGRNAAPGRNVIDLSQLDIAAISWLFLCWVGYNLCTDFLGRAKGNLIGTMAKQREAWLLMMLGRENRMLDLQIIRNLNRTTIFFASTSILIVAGLVTVLGATDKAIGIVANVPFVSELTAFEWELRLVLLVLVFVYAFFKFVWSIRQLSYCAVMIGGMAPTPEVDDACRAAARSIASLATLSAIHFNRGVRAYYFATAMLAWFIHPVALMIAASWVVIVLYRREFRSRTLTLLKETQADG
jgi:uncharacterized membrane protein